MGDVEIRVKRILLIILAIIDLILYISLDCWFGVTCGLRGCNSVSLGSPMFCYAVIFIFILITAVVNTSLMLIIARRLR